MKQQIAAGPDEIISQPHNFKKRKTRTEIDARFLVFVTLLLPGSYYSQCFQGLCSGGWT